MSGAAGGGKGSAADGIAGTLRITAAAGPIPDGGAVSLSWHCAAAMISTLAFTHSMEVTEADDVADGAAPSYGARMFPKLGTLP